MKRLVFASWKSPTWISVVPLIVMRLLPATFRPFWNTQADWFGVLAVLMAIPYLATIYVSLREPLAEPPPDSYTSKW